MLFRFDYELNEEGEACLLDTKEYQNSDFFFGNQFNAYPTQGSGADFRDKALEQMADAEISPYYGCVVNTEGIANELTAINALYDQYKPSIESGTAEEGLLETYIDSLKAAGSEKVVEFYQNALDTWRSENN